MYLNAQWTQNNVGIYYNSGNVGIGINDPNAKLEIRNELRVRLAATSVTKNVARIIPLGYSGSTGAMNWCIRGVYQYWNGVSNNDEGGDLDIIKSLNRNTILATKSDGSPLGNVGIGITNPTEKLVVDGKIISEEIKVEIVNGPDYVFDKDFDLITLSEVKAYIEEHNHLPEIPSAKEMEANGVDLGEMNMRLLQKIEELTLYTLAQEKQLATQSAEMEGLKSEVKELKLQNEKLEALGVRLLELEEKLKE